MSQIQAEVQLKFGIANFQRTFKLEIDPLDYHLSSPIIFFDNVVAYKEWYNWYNYMDSKNIFYDSNGLVIEQPRTDFTEYNGVEILKVKSAGKQRIRVYASPADGLPILTLTEPVDTTGYYPLSADSGQVPLNSTESSNPENFNFVPSYTGQPQPYIGAKAPDFSQPVGLKYMGMGSANVLDTITFNGTRAVSLKYNYVLSGITMAYATDFINKSGMRIPTPLFNPQYGLMEATEDCYGALVLNYNAPYWSFEATYSIPHGQVWPQLQIAWLRGDINQFPIPPIFVYARNSPPYLTDPASGLSYPAYAIQIATANLKREFFPAGASFSPPVDEEIPNTRKETTQRIYSPTDNTQYIDVATATEMQFQPGPMVAGSSAPGLITDPTTGVVTYFGSPPLGSDGTTGDKDPKQVRRMRFNPPTT